jgi:tetratricopeptide (TPR) repeat protein
VKPPPTDPLLGTTAGHYRLARRLGEGGMGAVYLGERIDDFTHRAAVKLLLEGATAETARRFQAEKEALAALRHPNIVKLLDAGATAAGIPYLVMDYVEGFPLDRYCRDRRLDLATRLDLVIQLLDAIAAAHRHLIVHCDLKPCNILVTSDGAVQVLDFGIAKLLDPARYGFTAGLTTTFRPLTPEFASPEQLSGEPITTATDLYAAGVLLYELLTGQHPFEDRVMQPVALLEAICFDPPEPPSRRAARLPDPPVPARLIAGDLDAVVLKAIAKEPDRRYPDAAAFADDLRRRLDRRPVLARPARWSYRASRFAARNRALAAAAAIATLAALFGAAGTLVEGVRAARARARAEARVADLRTLSTALLADYYDRVARLPGATAVQQMLVTRSLRYLDSMAAESRSDPTLSLELAGGFIKLAALEGSPYENNLGRPHDSLVTSGKAIAIADSARRSAAPEPRASIVLSQAHQARAEALLALGRIPEGVAECRAAADIMDRAIAGHADPDALLQAASTHETLADQLGSTGITGMLDRRSAETELLRALDLYRRAANPRARRAQVVVQMKLADLRWDADPLGALASYEQAQRDLETLPAAELAQLPNRRLRASLLRRRGEALGELDRNDEAAVLLAEDVRLTDSVLSIDPANERAIWDLAIAVNSLATVEAAGHRPAAALPLYRRVLDLLARMQPSTQTQLTEGDTLVAIGALTRNDARTRAGIAILTRVADRADSSSQALTRVANTLLTAKVDPARALAYLDRALAQPGVARDPSVALLKARALRRLGREREAVATAARALSDAPDTAQTSGSTRTRLETFLASH